MRTIAEPITASAPPKYTRKVSLAIGCAACRKPTLGALQVYGAEPRIQGARWGENNGSRALEMMRLGSFLSSTTHPGW